MTSRVVCAVLWTIFGLLIVAIWLTFLHACDLGFKPLFALRYCQQPQASLPPSLFRERQRQRELLQRQQEAELRLTGLPLCRSESRSVPEPQQAVPAAQQPEPEPEKPLTLPDKPEDLAGCWQSDRGDIEIVTDDERKAHIGDVRICYCFGQHGRGQVRMTYTDGAKCAAPLSAVIAPGKLVMRYPRLGCTGGHGYIVAADVVCTEGQGAALCDEHPHARFLSSVLSEKFHRVDAAYCSQGPGR